MAPAYLQTCALQDTPSADSRCLRGTDGERPHDAWTGPSSRGCFLTRVNRKTILVLSLLGYMVVIFPLYAWLTAAPSIAKLWVVELTVCSFVPIFIGTSCTVFALMFPTRSRLHQLIAGE